MARKSVNQSIETTQQVSPGINKLGMPNRISDDISKRVSSAIDTRINEGTFLPSAGSVPYGYLRDAVNNTYILDDESWLVVQKIFALRAKSLDFTAIAKQLNEEGIPCPGKLKHMRGLTQKDACADAIWIRKTIREILHDQVYIGNRVHGKRKTDGPGQAKYACPEADWTVIENAHPAIVSKELFNEVQRINAQEFEKHAAKAQRPNIVTDNRPIFQGKLFCHDCGKPMKAFKSGAKKGSSMHSFAYYDCGNYKESSGLHCSCHYIWDDVLSEMVKNALDEQCHMYLCEAVSGQTPQFNVSCDSIRKRLEEISIRKEILNNDLMHEYGRFIREQITQEEFMQQHTVIQQEYTDLEAEEEKLSIELAALEARQKLFSSYVDALSEHKKSRILTRACLDALIDKITIDTNRQVHINFRLQETTNKQ